jgi:hypothetical protein
MHYRREFGWCDWWYEVGYMRNAPPRLHPVPRICPMRRERWESVYCIRYLGQACRSLSSALSRVRVVGPLRYADGTPLGSPSLVEAFGVTFYRAPNAKQVCRVPPNTPAAL